MSHHLADVYRYRARRLRHLADELHHSPALRLHVHAGDDTWRGPRALASVADLRRAQVEVEREAHQLRVRADRFTREADRLDALALAMAG